MRTHPPSPRKVLATESARQDTNVPFVPAPALGNLDREMPHTGGFIPLTARSGHLYHYLYSMTLSVPDRSFNAFVGLTGPPHP